MRRLTRAALAATLVSSGLVLGVGSLSPAFACENVSASGICLDDTAPPPPPPPPPSGDTEGAGSQPGTCAGAPGGQCTNDYGDSWITLPEGASAPEEQNGGCYGFMLDPQPPAGDPRWEGHDPSEGAVWSCDHTIGTQETTWFVPNGQATVINAAAIAQSMLARAPFEVADVHTAPASEFFTYIGIDNWLWIPQSQWHDISLTENVGPASVTLTAGPSKLQWKMGDGNIKECGDAGRPWVKGLPDGAVSACSYAYTDLKNSAGDRRTITGRLFYSVSWTCTGRCSAPSGDLGEYPAPASSTCLEVRQRQTVNTGPGHGSKSGGKNYSTRCP